MHLTKELINRLIKINKTEGRNTQTVIETSIPGVWPS